MMIQLFCGDCLEIMPTLGRVDAVVTDPPYGININKSHRLSVSRGFGGDTWDDKPIDINTTDLLFVKSNNQIIWGGNYFELPPTRCFLIWDKNNDGRDFADVELAWTSLDRVARIFRKRPMNMDGGKVHPTQKPLALMEWCLSFLPDAVTILDPFMGSGTTGVACVNMGKSFIGIEKDPQYFEIAKERIAEAERRKNNEFFVKKPDAPTLFDFILEENKGE
jgi:DNA modification methylase